MKIHIFSTGYCKNWERIVVSDGHWRIVKFPSLCALIEHPTRGYILFDTGYSPRVFEAARSWPYRLYTWVTPITCSEEDSAFHAIAKRGIDPHDVATVFLSHFHADHLGGVRDFPHATFVYARSAYDAVKDLRGWKALHRCFLPDLLPNDFSARSRPFDDREPANCPTELTGFPNGYDILGDGSLIAIALPGHAQGQMGLYIPQCHQGPHFLIADSVWRLSTITANAMPHRLARVIIEDYPAFLDTVHRLQSLHHHHPSVRLIPTHDALLSPC